MTSMSDISAQPFTERLERTFYFTVAKLAARLGNRGIHALGRFLGALVWFLYRKRRNMAIANIKASFNLQEKEARRIARAAFGHNMCSFLECLLVPGYDYRKDPDFSIVGKEILDRIHQLDRPIVLVTGHLGAWEFIAALRDAIKTDGVQGMAVVRRYGSNAFNELMAYLRCSHGITVCGHRNAARPVLRVLKSNGFVSFLVDHHTAKESETIRLPFLGRETGVNIGPAVLAVRSNAIILPLAVFRSGNTYRLCVEEILDTATLSGSPDEKIHQVVAFYTKSIESLIRIAPEQWFWLHNRWK